MTETEEMTEQTTAPTTKKTSAKKKASPEKGTVVPGSELIHETGPLTLESLYTYWVGAFGNAPTGSVCVGGMDFQKSVRPPIRDPDGRQRKVLGPPRPGCLVTLTTGQLDKLKEALPLTLFRFTGADKSDEDYPDRGRPAIKIGIPAEVDGVRPVGMEHQYQVAHPGDEPVANYIWLQYCPSGRRPADGELPKSLRETGIEYPAEGDKPAAGPAPLCS